MPKPSYTYLETMLDCQLDGARTASGEPHRRFLMQTYHILKKLMADMQDVQRQLAEREKADG